jgi:hypothetical protein
MVSLTRALAGVSAAAWPDPSDQREDTIRELAKHATLAFSRGNETTAEILMGNVGGLYIREIDKRDLSAWRSLPSMDDIVEDMVDFHRGLGSPGAPAVADLRNTASSMLRHAIEHKVPSLAPLCADKTVGLATLQEAVGVMMAERDRHAAAQNCPGKGPLGRLRSIFRRRDTASWCRSFMTSPRPEVFAHVLALTALSVASQHLVADRHGPEIAREIEAVIRLAEKAGIKQPATHSLLDDARMRVRLLDTQIQAA